MRERKYTVVFFVDEKNETKQKTLIRFLAIKKSIALYARAQTYFVGLNGRNERLPSGRRRLRGLEGAFSVHYDAGVASTHTGPDRLCSYIYTRTCPS